MWTSGLMSKFGVLHESAQVDKPAFTILILIFFFFGQARSSICYCIQPEAQKFSSYSEQTKVHSNSGHLHISWSINSLATWIPQACLLLINYTFCLFGFCFKPYLHSFMPSSFSCNSFFCFGFTGKRNVLVRRFTILLNKPDWLASLNSILPKVCNGKFQLQVCP